jgi:hypothetical protein
MTDQDRTLAVREEVGQPAVLAEREPEDIIAWASRRATELSKVVESKGLFQMFGIKKHLVAEAWETVLALHEVDPLIEWTKPIDINGEPLTNDGRKIAGYKARAIIVQNGREIASGEMTCGMDEYPTQSKEGFAKHRAAMSAAETWAVAKAARHKFAWVVTLAGYEPTPAAEMEGVVVAHGDYGTCEKHGVPYFQSKNMRSPAHKADDGGWCNKPEEAPVTGPDRAYDQDGQIETRSPQQAAAGVKDVKGIKNGGDFMVYVNSRWAGHNQTDILGCLNVKKISDMTFTPKNVSGYVATLVGFWGEGDGADDGVIQELETEPTEEETTDVKGDADEAAVVQ